jgi:hypothetical protein
MIQNQKKSSMLKGRSSILKGRTRSFSAILFLSFVLSGCGSINKSSFRDMSTAYRDLVEEYTNDNLLINVVRSAENMPLSFLDIPSVTGQGSVSPGVSAGMTGLPSQPNSLAGFFSPGVGSSYNLGATLSVNSSFTFTQSSLDNSTFMTRFLAPLELSVLNNLSVTNAVDNMVLYAMVVSSISIIDENNVTTIKLINNPFSPDYPEFQLALARVVSAHLSVEQEIKRLPISPPLTIAEAKNNLMAISSATSKDNVVLTPIMDKSGRANAYQLEKMSMVPKLCFEFPDPLLSLDFSLPPSSFCEPVRNYVTKKQNMQSVKKPVRSMKMEFRSPRDIFYYLGALVKLQNNPSNPKMIGVLPSAKISETLTVKEMLEGQVPLFVVHENPSNVKDSLVHLDYMDKTYTIPKDNSGFSREVLTIMSQIVTLAKVTGSIPPSPAVLIR